MTPFNNHKPGFSFIEIMIAIMLLAIFGSSLFITQTKMLSTVSKTHSKIINTLQWAAMIPDFIIEKVNAEKQKKPFETISVNKKILYPEMTAQVSVSKIPENSDLFKKIGNYLVFANFTITRDDNTNHMINFLFNPPVEKAQEPLANEAV